MPIAQMVVVHTAITVAGIDFDMETGRMCFIISSHRRQTTIADAIFLA